MKSHISARDTSRFCLGPCFQVDSLRLGQEALPEQTRRANRDVLPSGISQNRPLRIFLYLSDLALRFNFHDNIVLLVNYHCLNIHLVKFHFIYLLHTEVILGSNAAKYCKNCTWDWP